MRGDREVSGSSVCEGVCEAPTFTEWSTMMVPTYPEDDSRALKVYQEHQQVGRVAHQAPAFEIEGKVQLSRDCAGRTKRNLHGDGRTARAARCATVKMAR